MRWSAGPPQIQGDTKCAEDRGWVCRTGRTGPVGKDIWDEASKVRSEGPLALVDGSPLGDNLEVGRLGLIRCQRLSVVWDP